MPISTTISLAVGGVLLIPPVLSQVAMWQRKEYRFDRMRAHLLTPAAGLEKERYLIISGLLVGLSWITYIVSATSPYTEWLGAIALVGYALHHGLRIKKIGVLRPVFTMKSGLTIGAIIVLLIAFFRWIFIPEAVPFLQMATLHFLLPLIAALAIPVVNIVFYIRKRQAAQQAARHRLALPNLTVVGITGSYGKTSTKHFLQHLLSATDKHVVVTPQHCNSYYCVALDFLQHVTSNTNIYIAEMGAYRRGEIKETADIVRPNIGVLTIIGNQHLHLFGSQARILETKWELAQSLPTDSTVVINADDPLLTEKAATWLGKRITFSTKGSADISIRANNILPASVSAMLTMAGHSQEITIPLASPVLLSSLAAAIATAYALGVSFEHIIQQIKSISAFPRTMEIRSGVHDATIIDDSYSAGEVPVKNALEHLAKFDSSDKRIVMVPLIELGNEGDRVHREIGEAFNSSGAHIYIFGEAYKNVIRQAAPQADITWYRDADVLTSAVLTNVTNNTVFLLEGRIPSITRKHIITQS